MCGLGYSVPLATYLGLEPGSPRLPDVPADRLHQTPGPVPDMQVVLGAVPGAPPCTTLHYPALPCTTLHPPAATALCSTHFSESHVYIHFFSRSCVLEFLETLFADFPNAPLFDVKFWIL